MARNFDSSPENAINRIVEGTQIEGDIRSESNIRIDGSFKGNIQTNGRLVVGPQGRIDGTVQCQNAEIEGSLSGKISVDDLLTLKNSAKLEGEIYTNKLSIEAGATFNGECKMGAKVKNLSPDKEESTFEQSEERTA